MYSVFFALSSKTPAYQGNPSFKHQSIGIVIMSLSFNVHCAVMLNRSPFVSTIRCHFYHYKSTCCSCLAFVMQNNGTSHFTPLIIVRKKRQNSHKHTLYTWIENERLRVIRSLLKALFSHHSYHTIFIFFFPSAQSFMNYVFYSPALDGANTSTCI